MLYFLMFCPLEPMFRVSRSVHIKSVYHGLSGKINFALNLNGSSWAIESYYNN